MRRMAPSFGVIPSKGSAQECARYWPQAALPARHPRSCWNMPVRKLSDELPAKLPRISGKSLGRTPASGDVSSMDAMIDYYSQRAPEYEEIYKREDPARRDELQVIAAELKAAVS